MTEELHEIVAEQLRSIDQRYTTCRRQIVDVLRAAEHPLTAPEIVARDPSLTPSSVYRNLATLERAGVASKIVTTHEHARFELAETHGSHHHHLVCGMCGRVADFTLPERLEHELDRSLARIAKRSGFTRPDHRLDLVGNCPDCA